MTKKLFMKQQHVPEVGVSVKYNLEREFVLECSLKQKIWKLLTTDGKIQVCIFNLSEDLFWACFFLLDLDFGS